MAAKKDWHPRDYRSLDDISAELDRFQTAHQVGTLRTTGGWSAGQILEHCATPMRMAMDGWRDEQSEPIKFPAHLKLVGTLLLKPTIGRIKFKPGIKVPGQVPNLLPQHDRDFDTGMKIFRSQFNRLAAGEQMTHPSPLFGKMSHNKWVQLHLDHCRLHFGFIQCD